MNISLVQGLPALRAGSPAAARTALVLHGGGGPRTVAPLVGHLAATMHAFAPTHPGWEGTTRPDSIASVPQLGAAYLARLCEIG
ncbi:alpha/beta hydrolase, partial [Streptomyces violaceoruber]